MRAPIDTPAEARSFLASLLADLEAGVATPGRWTTELYEKRDAWAIGIESRIARWDDSIRVGLRAVDVLRAKAIAVGALDDFAARVRTPPAPVVTEQERLSIRNPRATYGEHLEREAALRKADAAARAAREAEEKKGAA